MPFFSGLRQMRKLGNDGLVNRPLEGHNEVDQFLGVPPLPAIELGLAAVLRTDVDLAVVAPETHGEPALALAAILTLESNTKQIVGQVIGEPAPDLPHDIGAGHARLFPKLADGRV